MKMSEQINELALAFSKAQGLMRSASKDASNPFFKSHYATLASVIEAIREPFAINGLSFMQPCTFVDGNIIVETIILHSSGQFIAGDITGRPVKPDPQAIGSLISYLKRYLLQAMVGVASADDDGEVAMGRYQHNPIIQAPTPKKVEPLIDELYDKIISLLKKLTNNFEKTPVMEEKLKLLKAEIRIENSEQIKVMSEEDKLDIISLLKQKCEEEQK